MPGIRKRQGGDVAAIVAVLKDSTHRYGGLMRDGDLLDLANFVSHGQMDMQAAIESGRHSKTTNTSFEKHFGTLCGSCHGLDGRSQHEFTPLGDVARQRPYQVLHSILNGHPGDEMPALRLLGAETATRMLSFLQTLPTINLSVSIARGGRLYDNWQAEEGSRRQALPHPSYPRAAYYANDVQLTWRCKECHGWDYLGNQGDYASGQHATGIKGIRGMAGADPAQIVAVLRNTTHQYGTVLKDRDLQDLANFVRYGQVDMNAVIDRQSRRVKGDAGKGAGYYQTICAGCHGGGGKRITAPLGRLATANPWGVLHMMLNGHPDEKMPALRELDQHVLLDILAYSQGLQDTR
jgi:mono/diheme cytochrome c family protein